MKLNKHGVLAFYANGSSKTKTATVTRPRHVFSPLLLMRFFFALWLVRFAPLSPVAVEMSGGRLLVKGFFVHYVIFVSCDWPARLLQLPDRKLAVTCKGVGSGGIGQFLIKSNFVWHCTYLNDGFRCLCLVRCRMLIITQKPRIWHDWLCKYMYILLRPLE